jgi:hypothetical protein
MHAVGPVAVDRAHYITGDELKSKNKKRFKCRLRKLLNPWMTLRLLPRTMPFREYLKRHTNVNKHVTTHRLACWAGTAHIPALGSPPRAPPMPSLTTQYSSKSFTFPVSGPLSLDTVLQDPGVRVDILEGQSLVWVQHQQLQLI